MKYNHLGVIIFNDHDPFFNGKREHRLFTYIFYNYSFMLSNRENSDSLGDKLLKEKEEKEREREREREAKLAKVNSCRLLRENQHYIINIQPC